MTRFRSFLAEGKRRNVWKVAAAYAGVAAVLVGVASDAFPRLGLPEWTITFVIVASPIGLLLAVVLAWTYELRPEHPVDSSHSAGTTAAPSARLALRAGSDSAADSSVVVLPFADLSPDPQDAFFASGLTEELIADLSKLRSLRVISRTSSLSLKGSTKDVRTIARELDVRFVLEGSVRRAGDALRITAQLIDARLDAHLWAEKYAGTVDDVFDLQEKISRRIVEALRVNLTPDEDRQMAARPIPDVRAYEHYLRARAGVYSFDRAQVDQALRDLRAGLEILGDNILLLKGLGMALFQQLNAGLSDDLSVVAEIESCAARIRQFDLNNPGSFLLMGAARILHADMPGAVIQLREAYRRDPTDSDTLLWLGVASLSTGQMHFAGDLLQQLQRTDPLGPLSALLVAYHAFFEGRFDESAQMMEDALRMGADVSRWQAARAFMAAGQDVRAIECADYLRGHSADSPFAEAAGIMVCSRAREARAAPEPSEALRRWAERDGEWAQYLSDAYAAAGDPVQAFTWLERALAAGFFNHQYLVRHDPFIAQYREQSQWQKLLMRIQERHDAFEAGLRPLP